MQNTPDALLKENERSDRRSHAEGGETDVA
jgi:hypothetical protein